jgi:hypothetical protein
MQLPELLDLLVDLFWENNRLARHPRPYDCTPLDDISVAPELTMRSHLLIAFRRMELIIERCVGF